MKNWEKTTTSWAILQYSDDGFIYLLLIRNPYTGKNFLLPLSFSYIKKEYFISCTGINITNSILAKKASLKIPFAHCQEGSSCFFSEALSNLSYREEVCLTGYWLTGNGQQSKPEEAKRSNYELAIARWRKPVSWLGIKKNCHAGKPVSLLLEDEGNTCRLRG